MKKSMFGIIAAMAMTIGVFGAESKTLIRATRDSAVYKAGETVEFKISNPRENMSAEIRDGSKIIKLQKLDSDVITYQAKTPSFIYVKLSAGKNSKGRTITAVAGAAVDPEKIVPGVKRPADFDDFWDGELKQMRKSPLEIIKKTELDAKLFPQGITGYDIEAKRGDITITGFLVMPKSAKQHSLPAILTFNGASKVSAELPGAINFVKRYQAICFNLNFHALSNQTKRDAKLEAAARETVKNYQLLKHDDRQQYAMRKIYLRTVLTADFIQSLPEFDGKNMVSFGGSLGGAQSLVCAALVPEIKYCVSNATAMCDHYGKTAGHLPGWPNLFQRTRQNESQVAYFDVVNFASRVKCPIQMSVGFIDTTCPPASTYSAYNTLLAPKKMFHSVTGSHGGKIDKKDTGVFNFGFRDIGKYIGRK